MSTRPGRTWSVVCAALAGVWALLLLPPQIVVWYGYGVPPWALAIDRTPPYAALHSALDAIGLTDDYLVFGSAIGLSFLLLWWATGPVLHAMGRTGGVFNVLLFATGVLCVLSYLNHPQDAPLHFLWGAEFFALAALGITGIVVAVVARTGTPLWARLAIGATLVFEALGTLAFGYWPHGTVAGLSIQAVLLTAWAPRSDRGESG